MWAFCPRRFSSPSFTRNKKVGIIPDTGLHLGRGPMISSVVRAVLIQKRKILRHFYCRFRPGPRVVADHQPAIINGTDNKAGLIWRPEHLAKWAHQIATLRVPGRPKYLSGQRTSWPCQKRMPSTLKINPGERGAVWRKTIEMFEVITQSQPP